MVARGAQHLDARVARHEPFGGRVLAAQGADGAPPLAAVDEGGAVAEGVLGGLADGHAGLDLALDHRRRDDEGVDVQAESGLAGEGVDAQQDGLADAQAVDGRGHVARHRQGDAARVAARHEGQAAAQAPFGLRGERGQLAEVDGRRTHRAVAGEVHTDAGELDVREALD